MISRSLWQLNEVAMTFLKVAQSCLHFSWNFPKQKLYFISNSLVPLKNVKKAIAALSDIQYPGGIDPFTDTAAILN